MTGRVIHKPERVHGCAPGWTTSPLPPDDPMFGRYVSAIPPRTGDFPPGTVWRCSCGKRWVSVGRRSYSLWTVWRPERRRERRRRLGLRWWQREAR